MNCQVKNAYRFGFILTTAAGNMTRYLNLRKYAERDPEVECIWAPIKHYLAPDPFRFLPRPLRTRAVVMHEAKPVMSQYNRLDAIMFHAFEPYVVSAIRGNRHNKPLLVWSQDNPPISGSRQHPQYGGNHTRSTKRQRLRFWFDRWCARRASLFVPFSNWAGEILKTDCGVPQGCVHPINVGLDLELWPYVPKTITPASVRLNILFVGGDFARKGGDLLLKVYQKHFADTADLHLVTKEPPSQLPPHVMVHTDIGPNDPKGRQLYAEADIFVLPSRADMSPWVVMEAMATGRPVVSTRVGGIPDLIQNDLNGFLISPNDETSLTNRIRCLLSSYELRSRMGKAGRDIIESDYNAQVCVPRILEVMKSAVDTRHMSHRFDCKVQINHTDSKQP